MALAVTPSVTEYRYGDPLVALPSFAASGATGTVNWSTSSGVLSDATGASTELSSVNRTEVVTITAEDSLNTVLTVIQIFATFPFQPKWAIESDYGIPITRWPYVCEKRMFDEYFEVIAFFNWHKQAILEVSEPEDGPPKVRVVRGLPFYLGDVAFSELAKVYFDSPVRRSAPHLGRMDYSFQLMSFDFVVPSTIPSAPQTGIMMTEGGGYILLE